ncbi:hypothetical protein F4780DRAFT_118342 [Xylariomycetidae sp. FL0641]|nr:hypothetical protein F4780DRAFT_118342 [Xylariomycetidae sp. FL0641]
MNDPVPMDTMPKNGPSATTASNPQYSSLAADDRSASPPMSSSKHAHDDDHHHHRPSSATTTAVPLALKLALALLMVDALLELGFISSTVYYLNNVATQRDYLIPSTSSSDPVHLSGVPAALLVDQGHTSNGAAGTAFVLVGLGGILALLLRPRARALYYLWTALTVPAFLLTTGALAYVFAVCNAHAGQRIDVGLAQATDGPYPAHTWTPQGWFGAVLALHPVGRTDEVRMRLAVMHGWQYNLIPLFLAQLALTALALREGLRFRRAAAKSPAGVY